MAFNKYLNLAKKLPRIPVLFLVRAYQKTLSPDHSWLRHRFPRGYCKYYPSCSQYTHEAINEFGLTKGILKGSWRILRCNPWSRGGVDPIKRR